MSPFAARRVFLFGIQIAGAMGAHTLVELRPPIKSNASGRGPDCVSPSSLARVYTFCLASYAGAYPFTRHHQWFPQRAATAIA